MTHRIITALFLLCATSCFAADYPAPKEGDYTAKNFKFHDGESLPELRLHYATIGVPHRDARGQITNAVLILHGTGGSWKQFTQPQFANVLFGPGQPLDATRYYIILPDNVGHGGSSKPSNGLRMRFPQYDYDDMVAAQHLLVSEGLGVQHLRLIFGTSKGCMHSFVWGETYRDFMDALMPMACQTVEIAGRNRMWRKAVIDSIKLDPAWNNGEYKDQPVNGLRSATYILAIAGSAPLLWQRLYPSRDDADKFVEDTLCLGKLQHRRELFALAPRRGLHKLEDSEHVQPLAGAIIGKALPLGRDRMPFLLLLGRDTGENDRFHGSGRLLGLIGLDLRDLGREPALRFEGVKGVLEPQEVPFRQSEELAEPQIGIRGDVASPVDDRVYPVAGNADGMSKLVLAHADLAQKFLFQNLAGMGIAKLSHGYVLRLATAFNDNQQSRHHARRDQPTGNRCATGR